MATIYASAPGTGSGGSGTGGSPYANLFEAFAACSAGDALILNDGVYTPSMAWNTMASYGGWPSGTAISRITVRPATFTAGITRGIPAGTSSVIWRTSGGGAINMASAVAYWVFYGIDFDATNQDRAIANAYIALNYGANNNLFQNCNFSNRGQTSHSLVQHIELANTNPSTALLNNIFRRCKFHNAHVECSHDIYCRSSGNIFEYNDFAGAGKYAAIQYFSKNSPDSPINDNIIRFNFVHGYPDAAPNNALFSHSLNINRNLHYGNVVWDCPTRDAFYLQGGSGINGPAVGNSFVYNTVVNCKTGIKIRDEAFAYEFEDTIVKNNICYDNVTNMDLGSYSTNPIVSNNATDGTDPVFVGTGDDPYALDAGSPYLTSGTVVGSPYDDQDMLGVIRPQTSTTPTLGAYEYDAGLTPEPPTNQYANPGGYTIQVNEASVLPGLSVVHEAGLVTACWLSLADNATWTDVDTSGGGTSN